MMPGISFVLRGPSERLAKSENVAQNEQGNVLGIVSTVGSRNRCTRRSDRPGTLVNCTKLGAVPYFPKAVSRSSLVCPIKCFERCAPAPLTAGEAHHPVDPHKTCCNANQRRARFKRLSSHAKPPEHIGCYPKTAMPTPSDRGTRELSGEQERRCKWTLAHKA